MKVSILAFGLVLVAATIALVPSASARPDLGFCSYSLGNDSSCPYMLCYHPHYNEWGNVQWCEIGMYYPCQFCVPPPPIE